MRYPALLTPQERAERYLEYQRQYQRNRRANMSDEQLETHRKACRQNNLKSQNRETISGESANIKSFIA